MKRRAGAPTRRLLAPGVGLALVVLAFLLPYVSIDVPGILPGPSYTAGSLQLLAYAMLIAALALSYHLLFGVAGMLSFGHALFFAAGAYGLTILLREATWLPGSLVFLGAIVLTVVAGLVLAAVVGVLSLRVSGISFAMVTLAFAQAGSEVVVRNPGGNTGGGEGLAVPTAHVPHLFVGVANTAYLYWLCLALLVAVYGAVLAFELSRAGHVAKGVRENELRVSVLGMSPYWTRFVAFLLASALAVACGVAYALLQGGVTPTIGGSDFTLTLLVVVVLGGVGYRWGAVAGGIVYAVLDQRLGAVAGSDFVAGLPGVMRVPLSEPMFLLGTCFVLVVLFLPGGIAGFGARISARAATPVSDAAAPAVGEHVGEDLLDPREAAR